MPPAPASASFSHMSSLNRSTIAISLLVLLVAVLVPLLSTASGPLLLQYWSSRLAHSVGLLPPQNHYELLGIDRAATEKEINRAFRKLSLTHHPDKSSEPSAKFLELSEAKTVLLDPVLREEYDMKIDAGLEADRELAEERFARLYHETWNTVFDFRTYIKIMFTLGVITLVNEVGAQTIALLQQQIRNLFRSKPVIDKRPPVIPPLVQSGPPKSEQSTISYPLSSSKSALSPKYVSYVDRQALTAAVFSVMRSVFAKVDPQHHSTAIAPSHRTNVLDNINAESTLRSDVAIESLVRRVHLLINSIAILTLMKSQLQVSHNTIIPVSLTVIVTDAVADAIRLSATGALTPTHAKEIAKSIVDSFQTKDVLSQLSQQTSLSSTRRDVVIGVCDQVIQGRGSWLGAVRSQTIAALTTLITGTESNNENRVGGAVPTALNGELRPEAEHIKNDVIVRASEIARELLQRSE